MAQLFNLTKHWKGKTEVVMTDTFVNVRKRLATLKQSQRGGIKNQTVEYTIDPVETNKKFRKKPDYRWE